MSRIERLIGSELKTRDMEEFVLNFVREGSITPIDIVMEITRLTYDEVKSCSEILVVA